MRSSGTSWCRVIKIREEGETPLRAARIRTLTFRRAIDDLVLLLGVLEDALGAEHVTVLHTVELDFLARVRLTILDLALRHLAVREVRICGRGHGQAGEDLVVDWEVVWADVVSGLVVRALNHAVFRKFAHALAAEGMPARQRGGLFFIMVVRLEADAAFKYRVAHSCDSCG